MKFNSLKFELIFFTMLMVGIILVVFSGLLYVILSRTLYTELDNELKVKSNGLVQSIRAYLDVRGEDPRYLQYAVEQSIVDRNAPNKQWLKPGFERRWNKQVEGLRLDEEYINFVSPRRASLFRSPNMNEELTKAFLKRLPTRLKEPEFVYVYSQQQMIRVISVPFIYKQEPLYIVQIGQPVTPVTMLLHNLINSLVIGVPLILLLTYFMGELLASRILKPIEEIIKTARNISYKDLSLRIDSKYFHSEMNHLIQAFNDMIARLQKSFQHIEDFSGHAAHELKTPLTIIRGENEIALLEKRDSREYQRVLQVTLDESARMLRIIEDLLLLTRLDYQPKFIKFTRFDFRDFMKEIYEESKVLAQSKRIKFNFSMPDEPIVVEADKHHLRRMFFNLIDNAVKFTPPQGQITMDVKKYDMQVHITLSDSGRGIIEEHLDKIFDRFFRSEPSEVGNGLGLSIVQSVARIHHGSVEVKSKPSAGSTFLIKLPLVV